MIIFNFESILKRNIEIKKKKKNWYRGLLVLGIEMTF